MRVVQTVAWKRAILTNDGGAADRIRMMQKQSSSEIRHSVLEPTTPVDIGARSQRQRIVAAMIASCAEKTYAATTISDIVARARISRTTFYKRFNDKRECFDSAVEVCVEELRAAIEASHSTADSPADATRRATAAVLETMAAKPELAQLLAGDAISVDSSPPWKDSGVATGRGSAISTLTSPSDAPRC
jgi:hypothetical protein